MSDSLCTALGVIGGAFLLVSAIRILKFIQLNYFTSINVKKRYAKAGNWAVVTGASDGIGRGMATDLARRGMNVVLISRTQAKLEEVAEELKAKYKIETKCIAFDFSSANEHAYKKLVNDIAAIDVAILVNNVGINYSYPQNFETVDVEEDLKMLTVNCESIVRLTKAVLPKMKERKSGAIINLSSFSAKVPTPLLATYSGTKAFAMKFSESLAEEVRPFGIDVMSVSPNLVVSRMSAGVSDRKPKTSFLVVSAESMAKATLNKLGSTSSTDGHPHHGIVAAIATRLPAFIFNPQMLKMQKATNKKALRKLGKQ